MNRTRRKLVPALLAALVFSACGVVSSDQEPEPDTGSGSDGSTSSSSNSSGTAGDNVTGSGNVVTEQRPVAGFDRVSISGIGELIIDRTGEESLTIEAEDNLLPLLVSEVEGGRLTLGIRPNTSISSTRPIVYRLNARSLREISGEGSVRITASGLETAQFTLISSGTVASVVSGSAGDQDITLSGTGSFDGSSLTGATAEVDVSGTAQALVNVTRSLRVRASGTAVVRYLGDPEVDRTTSGLGRVEKAQ